MPITTRQTTGLDRRVFLAGLEVSAASAVATRPKRTREWVAVTGAWSLSPVTDSRGRSLRRSLRPALERPGGRGGETVRTVPSRPRRASTPRFGGRRKFIPVEFSGLAYRFEHGVVRPSYWANLRGYPGGNPDSGSPAFFGFVSAAAGPVRPAGGAWLAGVGASIGKVRPATKLTWALTPSQLVNVAGW